MKIQEIIHFRGKTQGEIASHLGISASHFSDVCRGKTELKLTKVIQLADFIGADHGDVAKAFIAVRESYERGEQRGE